LASDRREERCLPRSRICRGPWHAALTIALALLSSPAWAQPTAADRETARSLLIDGRAKMSTDDFQGAEKAFRAAHAIMNVPTTGLDLARALVAQGQLVEGRDTALTVSRMPPGRDEPWVFTKARESAKALAESLSSRIPSLVIRIEGPDPGSPVEVRVDGVPIVASALGLPRKVDPGQRKVIARAPGFHPEERVVTVAEGAAVPLEISLRPLPAAPEPASAPTAPPTSASKAPLWPWIVGGAGVAVATVGAAFLVDHAAAQTTIADDCPRGVCDPARYRRADVAALEARRNRSGVAGIALTAAGGAAAAVGVVGLVALRSRPERGSAGAVRVSALPSADGLGVRIEGGF
jgi:hypothetical protein